MSSNSVQVYDNIWYDVIVSMIMEWYNEGKKNELANTENR